MVVSGDGDDDVHSVAKKYLTHTPSYFAVLLFSLKATNWAMLPLLLLFDSVFSCMLFIQQIKLDYTESLKTTLKDAWHRRISLSHVDRIFFLGVWRVKPHGLLCIHGTPALLQ